MKVFLLPMLAAALLPAGEYAQEDRQALIGLLEESKRQVVVVIESTTQEQTVWKPDDPTWSILQVLEHLGLAEDFLFGLLQKSLEGAKPIPDDQALPDPSSVDNAIRERTTDRTQRVKAPEAAVPKNAFQNRDDAFRAFAAKRAKTIEFVRTTKLDLRRNKFQSPMGVIDAHQWLIMMSAHTERHVKQISELKKHELFPKSE